MPGHRTEGVLPTDDSQATMILPREIMWTPPPRPYSNPFPRARLDERDQELRVKTARWEALLASLRVVGGRGEPR
ncbi:hypothetical protein GCM10012275_42580 [Longimycelium tulufanense]|uniref:Uncharacterized protein n=1 Tax=Longimycelium tulufanense TaxID=907463 RepID=A0A8J3FY05_9PSEU|nr:hypothetical protein [Longimycelium tulufanense]GGM67464.1 hypothetical protein GCM10012275_42580 [Longimycelium tulufanense]